MTDYDKMLIDLLNDKINRLKAEIRELKKGVNTDEK